jgi:hypothetical protein
MRTYTFATYYPDNPYRTKVCMSGATEQEARAKAELRLISVLGGFGTPLELIEKEDL